MSMPVVPDGGGFVVISQVRPQNDQGNGPGEEQFCNAPTSLPKPVVTFYKGEPEVLGVTQIFAGILLISISILISMVSHGGFIITFLLISAAPLLSGILNIVSGSLSMNTSVHPTTGKVKANIGMNIFSSLASFLGIFFVSMDIHSQYHYHSLPSRSFCAYYKSDIQCLGVFTALPLYNSIMVFILMLLMLMFCINISACVFACRTICRSSFDETHVVIYQTTSLIDSDTTGDILPESTAALTSDVRTRS